MSDILAEVDEALRRERLEKIWKEHGKTILTALVMVVLGTAAGSAYRAWNHQARITGTDKLLALMEDTTFPENVRDTEPDMRPGLKGIVLLNAAQSFLKQGKNEDALALYTKVAGNRSIPDDLRGLAILMQVRLVPDAAANAALMKELESVWRDNGNPWQHQARLEAASLSAASGDFKAAREHLSKILDEKGLPETLYGKARALDHVYALKEKQKAVPAKTGS